MTAASERATSPAQALFAVASLGSTGLFVVEAGGSTARLELERGWVHAVGNVERARSDEEAVGRLFDRVAGAAVGDARSRFEPRPESSPMLGRRVTPFHPTRPLRAHFERHMAPRAGDFSSSRLRLSLVPHPSCLELDEQHLVALLSAPRRFDELLPLTHRPRLERLLRFLEAAGALLVEDATLVAAWAELGLAEGAPLDEVKRAWRRLARDLHPDRHPDASDDERRALEARFRAVADAYRRLVPGG